MNDILKYKPALSYLSTELFKKRSVKAAAIIDVLRIWLDQGPEAAYRAMKAVDKPKTWSVQPEANVTDGDDRYTAGVDFRTPAGETHYNSIEVHHRSPDRAIEIARKIAKALNKEE